eukprot:11679134-Karenia_brevis.AAC.1
MHTIRGPSQKLQRVGDLSITFGESERAAEMAVGNTYSYIMGLTAVVYTMALAGSFTVTRGDQQ